MRLFLVLLFISFNLKAATWWPSGDFAVTFQNGVFFGNSTSMNCASGDCDLSTNLLVQGYMEFDEIAIPSAPPASAHRTFFDTNGDFRKKNNAGDELRVDDDDISQAYLLNNRRFENSAACDGWTNSAGTLGRETTTKLPNGDASCSITLTAQTLQIEQSFNCDAFNGETVGFKVHVNSTDTVEACFMQGATEAVCNASTNPDDFELLTVAAPAVSGSNCGLRIKTTGNVTDVVYIDDAAFVSNSRELSDASTSTIEEYRLVFGGAGGGSSECSSSPCTIHLETGTTANWINGNVVRVLGGQYQFTTNAVFNANQYVNCFCHGSNLSISNAQCGGLHPSGFQANGSGVISFDIFLARETGAATDSTVSFVCFADP